MGEGSISSVNTQVIQRRDATLEDLSTPVKSDRSLGGMAVAIGKSVKHLAWKLLSGGASLAWQGIKGTGNAVVSAACFVARKCQEGVNYMTGGKPAPEPTTVEQVNTFQFTNNPLHQDNAEPAAPIAYRQRNVPDFGSAPAPNSNQTGIQEDSNNDAQNVLNDLENAFGNKGMGGHNYRPSMSADNESLFGGALPPSVSGDDDSGSEIGYQNVDNNSAQSTVSPIRQKINEAKNGAFYQACKNDKDDMAVTKQAYERAAGIVLSRPGATQLMQQHGLTLDEAVALHIYTTDAYTEINNDIREDAENNYDNLPAHIKQLKDNFESGLAKLPSAAGTSYRGAKLPARVGNLYQPNETIKATGLFSSSADSNSEFPDANYSITITLKQGSAGKNITAFSNNPREQEIAFPTGTQFVVDTRTKDGQFHKDHIAGNAGALGTSAGQIDITMHEI